MCLQLVVIIVMQNICLNFHWEVFLIHLSRNIYFATTNIKKLRVGSIPTFHLKSYEQLFGQRLDGKIQEKRSAKRNRGTFATVLFLFRSVTPVPRKLD